LCLHSKALKKPAKAVTPAKAGVQKCLKTLDSGLRRNDEKRDFRAFYEAATFASCNKGFVIYSIMKFA